MLSQILAHPLTRGLDLDDPETTAKRVEIIHSKPFLKKIYAEWYSLISNSLPEGEGSVLELGSGAGYMKDYIPGLITSDIFPVPGVDHVVDALSLPFETEELRGIVMSNVLHHIPDVEKFFHEASRCVRPGGVLSMIEPWVTPFSTIVYRRLHHEPFDVTAQDWKLAGQGPLSDANGALPWIVFERDRKRFERDFPMWEIERIQPFMPFRYLLSGGVSMRSLMPGFLFGFWRAVEWCTPSSFAAMFAHITLKRL